MTNRAQSQFVSRNRNKLREEMLRRLANMRAAKARKRSAKPIEREPRLERWYPIELGLRDRRTGETAWVPFRSIRDAIRRLSVVRAEYQ